MELLSITVNLTNEGTALLRNLGLFKSAMTEVSQTPAPSVEATPAPAPPAPEQPAPAKPAEPASAEEPKIGATTDDVLAAIDRCRVRFIGEDYKTNKTSENYKKYYKALNAALKNVAYMASGTSEKPSELSSPAARLIFVRCADELEQDADGNFLTPKAPF